MLLASVLTLKRNHIEPGHVDIPCGLSGSVIWVIHCDVLAADDLRNPSFS